MSWKKIGIWFAALLLAISSTAQIEKYVPKRPDPPRLVNDFTKTLTAAQTEALEAKLVAYDDSTSNQVAIVVIPTTGDYPIEDVALKILRDWGVGNKDKNNGIVLLVAKDDRKLRIETGYGLEGAIPDITAKNIIENEILPSFKEGNYYRGLDKGADAIIKAAAGEYKAPEGYGSRNKSSRPAFWTVLLVIIILFIIMGAAGGAAGGTYVSRGGSRGWTGGGWWTGGGGSSGGGGWSGGGGGGFGGFGGGGGGGGGASGSW